MRREETFKGKQPHLGCRRNEGACEEALKDSRKISLLSWIPKSWMINSVKYCQEKKILNFDG